MRRGGGTQDGIQDQRGLVGLARRLTPAGNVRRLDLLLARAGRPAAWPLERVLVTKVLLTAAVAGLMALMVLARPSGQILSFTVAVVVLAWYVEQARTEPKEIGAEAEAERELIIADMTRRSNALLDAAQRRHDEPVQAAQRTHDDTVPRSNRATRRDAAMTSRVAHDRRSAPTPSGEEVTD